MKFSKKEMLVKHEELNLAPYAALSKTSRGRRHNEDRPSMRTEYARDRDRVIHCSAFRRLEYKTQVFVNHEGDHYRTRLTHTLEVSQIARSIGRLLRLNEDLIEAIVLSHDLGHTPFGHSGEEKMKDLTLKFGGFKFEHNEQSLRVVDLLEKRYPMYPGLNLTYEVREGIIKHCTDYDKPQIPDEFSPEKYPTLEAQIVDLADEIAYNNHDLDDGLASGMLSEESVMDIELFKQSLSKIKTKYPDKKFSDLKKITISEIITALIEDLVEQTCRNLKKNSIGSPEDVRRANEKIVSFSSSMKEKNTSLKSFLHKNLYKHSRVLRMEEKAKRIINDLFVAYRDCIDQIPGDFRHKFDDNGNQARIICDYIAGMTDRFAIDEHKKLFDPHEKV